MDLELLRKHVADGIVYERRHSMLPLSIYNYSPRVQYEKLWDDVTAQCRGLVMQGETVVARPFRKFFNDTEHQPEEVPWHLPSEVTEKLDGSLLIAFHFDGLWRFATRGSFDSPQSAKGCEIFNRLYRDVPLDPDVTYLFEVLYPQNRIVVDYRGREDTVLLGMFHAASGHELSLDDAPAGLTVVRRLPAEADGKALRSIIRDDEEGYVVRFANGFRMKVKGERYMQLHRLITGISSRSIWEHLSSGTPLDEVLAMVPDEFGGWVRQERAAQLAAFDALNAQTESAYLAVKGLPDRKSKALRILADFKDVAGATFAALDGKPTAALLWKQLYPEFRRPDAAERIEA